MSRTMASTSSKSSDRQVQLTIVACRDVATRSATPRSSSSSARTSADRCTVPRSSTRPVRYARPRAIGRLVHAARIDHRVDRHGRRGRRLLNDHDGAAVEHGPDGRQPSQRQPSSRLVLRLSAGAGTSRRCGSTVTAVRRATSDTSSAVTRATRACSSSKYPGPVTVSKYPKLVRDVRHAIGLEDEAGTKLPAGPCRLLIAHAELADLVDLVDSRGLEPGQRHALHRRQRNRCTRTAAR